MDASARDRLRAIGTFVDELENPAFVAGTWHRSERTREDPNVWTMPWFELSPRALAFVTALGGLVTVFDWPAWAQTPEAQALHDDRGVLAAATLEDLTKLVTAVLREDRFVEGALGASFESGLMAAIARRAGALVE